MILTARNDAGEESFSELIPVNDPTVLGFIVSDSSGALRLKDAEIWIYGDTEEMENRLNPHFHGITDKVGTISRDKVREIAEQKMEDLNAVDIEGATNIIAGTARSMGLVVEG